MEKMKVILIGDSKNTNREDTTKQTGSVTDNIHSLMQSLECKIDQDYYDIIELRNYARYEAKPYRGSEVLPPPLIDPSDLINLGAIFIFDYLRSHGVEVNYIPNFITHQAELREALNHSYDAVLVSSTILFPKQLFDIIKFVNEHNNSVPIVVGGQLVYYIMSFQKYILEFSLGKLKNTFLIWESKGEVTLLKLLHAIKNQQPVECIPNLVYVKDNALVETAREIETQKIDHHLISWDTIPPEYLQNKPIPIQTSAGCPYHCAYCTFCVLHSKVELKSLENLEKELNSLRKHSFASHLSIVDDMVSVTPKRLIDVAKMMVKNRFPFHWSAMLRSDAIKDAATAKLLKESGMLLAYIGIESFDNQILSNMHKKLTADDHLRAISLLKEAGILVVGSFIFGFPGETQETFATTLKHIKESEIDLCEVHLWNNLPGAPVYNSNEFNIKGNFNEWKHDTMDAYQCMQLIIDLFKTVPHQFASTDDCVSQILSLHIHGHSVKEILEFYRAKSSLILNNMIYNEKKLTETEYRQNIQNQIQRIS